MQSNELRFRHVGLSSDGAVIFCEMDNGKTYAMPIGALAVAEEWDPTAKPKAVRVIHDGYAAVVKFNTEAEIDFPSGFVVHHCEPSYRRTRQAGRSSGWSIGGRIREIRKSRGLTLDALAARCGIAKPNLSRLENDKVTPTFQTLQAVAAALDSHPALLVQKDAWWWTQHEFDQWKLALRSKGNGTAVRSVHSADLVKVFLATRSEHRYARRKLMKHARLAPHHSLRIPAHTVDAEKWHREVAIASEARVRGKTAAT